MEKIIIKYNGKFLEKQFSSRMFLYFLVMSLLFQAEIVHAAGDAPMFSLANTDFVVAIE